MSRALVATVSRIGRTIPDEVAFPIFLKRLIARRVVTDRGCWHSHQKAGPNGYVQATLRAKRFFLHKLSYVIHKGPIPEGLFVLHECDNRRCWNPDHLWLGTISDNKQDEIAKGRNFEKNRSHCPSGHAYSGDNLWVDSRGFRHCRECKRERDRRKWRDKPEEMRERLRRYRQKRKLRVIASSPARR